MKKLLSLSFAILIASSLFSQTEIDSVKVDPAWRLSGITGINASQTSLSNWSGGGENSFAGNVYLNAGLLYKEGRWAWENNLALDYGLTRMVSTGVRKSADKIDFASKLGYEASKVLFYTALFDFKTQFTKGYEYKSNPPKLISNLLAPAYSTLSLGLDYRPCDCFSLYFSPIAGKLTLNTDKALDGLYGVPTGKTSRLELGAYLKTVYKKRLMENVDLISKADFFTAYNSSFGNIDVDWDVLVSMKINEFLSATLNTTLRYDDDVKSINKDGTPGGPRVQFREIFGLGLAYKF